MSIRSGVFVASVAFYALLVPEPAAAQCARTGMETYVQAAVRCVGWIHHDAEPVPRSGVALLSTPMRATSTAAGGGRREFALGAGAIANELFATIADVAVERARRHGLQIVHGRLEGGVCGFPPPAGFTTAPLFPETCALVRSTDLMGLFGQANAFRGTLTADVLRIGSTELRSTLAQVPEFRVPVFQQTVSAVFVLLQRRAVDPSFRPGREDVQPIAETFLNQQWGSAAGPFIPINRSSVALQTALSVARVYTVALQMRRDEQDRFSNEDAAALSAGTTRPTRAAGIDDTVELLQVAGVQLARCPRVFASPANICPSAALELLDWVNLGLRALNAASLVRNESTDVQQSGAYHEALRAAATLLLDSLAAITAESSLQAAPLVKWVRAVGVAALDSDVPRVVGTLADLAATSIGSAACDGDCSDRRKTIALLSAVSAYAVSYVQVPASATPAERTLLLEQQHTARKEALNSVIDAATDRRNRAGNNVWSLGTNVGATIRSRQVVRGEPGVFYEPLALHLPIGVAWQRLPSPGWRAGIPLHVMAAFADLGNYVAKERATNAAPDWQAIIAPGLQIALPLSTSPSHFFLLGGTVSYIPRFKTTSGQVRSAWHSGAFVSFYVPLWDFN